MIRVLHIITGIGYGGAEMALLKLITSSGPRFRSHILSLSSDLSLAGRLEGTAESIHSLDLPPRLTSLWRGVQGVSDEIRTVRPHVVQTWMYHADLLGGLVSKWHRLPVVWNVQSGTLDANGIRRRTIRLARVCAMLSHQVPAAIVSCSHAGVEAHTRMGYRRSRFRVIANGVNPELFKPDSAIRALVRAQLGIGPHEQAIGMIARYHPQKDHANFLRAAREIASTHPRTRFVLVGPEIDRSEEIERLLQQLGLQGRTLRLGVRADIPNLLCALDLHVLSSAYGEGFPNVLAEAMSAGVPCVVTNVGDSALIVADTGRAVPAQAPAALAAACREILDLPDQQYQQLRQAARARVQQQFSLEASVRQYERLYDELVGGS